MNEQEIKHLRDWWNRRSFKGYGRPYTDNEIIERFGSLNKFYATIAEYEKEDKEDKFEFLTEGLINLFENVSPNELLEANRKDVCFELSHALLWYSGSIAEAEQTLKKVCEDE